MGAREAETGTESELVPPNRLDDEWATAVEQAAESILQPCFVCGEPTLLKDPEGHPCCWLHQPYGAPGIGARLQRGETGTEVGG